MNLFVLESIAAAVLASLLSVCGLAWQLRKSRIAKQELAALAARFSSIEESLRSGQTHAYSRPGIHLKKPANVPTKGEIELLAKIEKLRTS